MILEDLYQDVILDHGRRPRSFGRLPEATHVSEGFNPLCGDQVSLELRIVDGTIEDVMFSGKGCAISTASASILTDLIRGRTVAEARGLAGQFFASVTTEIDPDDALGDAVCLAGVRKFPNRIKCATMVWHAMLDAMKEEPVATAH